MANRTVCSGLWLMVMLSACGEGDPEWADWKPVLLGVEPAVVCPSDQAEIGYSRMVKLTGANFTPIDPLDPWGGTRVWFHPDGNPVFAMSSFNFGDYALWVQLSTSLGDSVMAMVYDVEVVNPNGQSSLLEGGFTYLPEVRLTEVSPASGEAGTIVALNLVGRGFYGPLDVRIGSGTFADTFSIVPDSSETATAFIDISSAMTPGVYQVTIENQAGCSATLDQAFEVL